MMTHVLFLFLGSLSAHSIEDCGTQEPQVGNERLISQINEEGLKDLWSIDEPQELSFCISNVFRSSYDHIKTITVLAAEEWMKHANVDFKIVDNMSCEDNPRDVLFRVVPTSRRVPFKARAFFPSSERRKIQINRKFTDISEADLKQLMLHELGHVLGFRHEHIHPAAGGECLELGDFEPITDYDPSSIMHYPNCDQGLNNYVLSDLDKVGAGTAYP